MFRLDESDPQFLLVYAGDEHPQASDYDRLIQRWSTRIETETAHFGVIIIVEPHEHHDDERDGDEEAKISKLINDFRHSHRERNAQITLGFANVVTLEEAEEAFGKEPEDWERAQENANRFTQYMFGIPGRNFLDVEEAKRWLTEQSDREFVAPPSPVDSSVLDGRIGLYYGSTTGVTEYIALKIQTEWQNAGLEALAAVNIGHLKDAAQMLQFQYLLLGIPTWNTGKLQDDWAVIFPQLDALDFTGKHIALFGIGDQYNYSDNYLDAMGILGDKLRERGAELHGFWDSTGYEIAESRALQDGRFIGLGIDEVSQSKLTDERIHAWVAQVIQEFALQHTLTA